MMTSIVLGARPIQEPFQTAGVDEGVDGAVIGRASSGGSA